ncbi:MAG: CoA transferase [Burkholderiales bacterium]|nr:CoA transferase [Burkholderiales bacterium]OJX08120.1 MAG: carnitine dehydratase [Burkholderiales bacterium 70-64]
MGPLAGIRIVEFAGIGPGPMCAMLLADMGATVLRVARKGPTGLGIQRPLSHDLLLRNRYSIEVDLKRPESISLVLDLVGKADALIEGFRPGVMERLGLGPDICLGRNPRLVYGRMTGWGQTGPLAHAAGHDINYVAVTGVLAAIGRRNQLPSVPLNLVGDFGGGSMYLAMGILAALLEARSSGKGQVVDAAIVDGTASLATLQYGMHGAGVQSEVRGDNVLDTGAHFYDVYECADGKLISIGPIEGRFYAELLRLLEIDAATIGPHLDRASWQTGHEVIAGKFMKHTRKHWCELLEGTDVCFAPVLTWSEAPNHPHLEARGTFVEVAGVTQPAPAPRFSRTVSARPTPPQPVTRENTAKALSAWLDTDEIEALFRASVID